MERLNISTEPVHVKFSNGSEVKAKRLDTAPRPIPSDTARHEAAHVVAAGKIVSATIIPEGSALGSTTPVVMTPEAAAAAGAMGHDGCGWDRFLTEHYLGVPWEVAKASASATLADKKQELDEVATILEEKKTIGQNDVVDAHMNVFKKRNGIHPVEIEVTSPEGKKSITTTISQKGEIKLEDHQLKLIGGQEQDIAA